MVSCRGILETHLRCAECGTNLSLSYEKEARLTTQKSTKASNITGASKVEISVFIEPCRVCMEPAENILKAVKVLQDKGVLR